jgi:hypothetical protein
MLKERQFLSIYEGYLESGLTVRDYCTNQNMTDSMFYYWQNKLKGQLPPKRGFVPVVFDNGKAIQTSQVPTPVQNRSKTFPDPAATNNTISCEISYPNGVCLKLNGLTNTEMLRSLLLLTNQ